MADTGRYFMYDSQACELITAIPDHDDWDYWTEWKDEDGDLWYSSGHEGMQLDAEEFGPFEDSDVMTAESLMTLGILPARFELGDEWSEKWGHYIIVNVEDVKSWDDPGDRDQGGIVQYVWTFDYEGILERQPAWEWAAYVTDMGLERVTEPDLEERLEAWREQHDTFPLWPDPA